MFRDVFPMKDTFKNRKILPAIIPDRYINWLVE